MKLEIPGQFRGAECRTIPRTVIAIRKVLEPMFQEVEVNGLSKISLVLRVGGSLGEFAPEPSDGQPIAEASTLVCNVSVPDHGWANQSEPEVKAIVASYLKPALVACCHYLELSSDHTGQILSALAQPGAAADGFAAAEL